MMELRFRTSIFDPPENCSNFCWSARVRRGQTRWLPRQLDFQVKHQPRAICHICSNSDSDPTPHPLDARTQDTRQKLAADKHDQSEILLQERQILRSRLQQTATKWRPALRRNPRAFWRQEDGVCRSRMKTPTSGSPCCKQRCPRLLIQMFHSKRSKQTTMNILCTW